MCTIILISVFQFLFHLLRLSVLVSYPSYLFLSRYFDFPRFFSTCFWEAWKAQDILLFFAFYTFFVIILHLNFFFISLDITPYYNHYLFRQFFIIIIIIIPYTVTSLTPPYSFRPLPFFKSCFCLFSLVFCSLYFCSIFLQLFLFNFVVFEGQWNPRDFMYCAKFREVRRLLSRYCTVHQDQSHLYNFTKKCLQVIFHLTLLQHVSCIQNWLIYIMLYYLGLIPWRQSLTYRNM